jgi:hypothetical protein
MTAPADRTKRPRITPPPGSYNLDPERSTVLANVKALFDLVTVHGLFRVKEGQVVVAEDSADSTLRRRTIQAPSPRLHAGSDRPSSTAVLEGLPSTTHRRRSEGPPSYAAISLRTVPSSADLSASACAVSAQTRAERYASAASSNGKQGRSGAAHQVTTDAAGVAERISGLVYGVREET